MLVLRGTSGYRSWRDCAVMALRTGSLRQCLRLIGIADLSVLGSGKDAGSALGANRDSKSGSLTIWRTAAACAHDNRYP